MDTYEMENTLDLIRASFYAISLASLLHDQLEEQ